jgi:LAS superfamily LD-carboxypeptidase LdcB
LEFTGKDTAAGKTWENWVRRYVEKRLAGEQANIDAEVLD